ncbi:MAG: cytidine deaminase [Sphingobacteriaceae bacterium]|nr:cytidine deaminase [Sphingobacteriaceae bacterium]
MNQLKIEAAFDVFANENDLNKEDLHLLQSAKVALNNAYAPYSKFLVGAAILLENDVIVTGNNQENAAYPSGMCAERVAAFHASSLYPNIKFKTIAISVKSENRCIDIPVSPCGACRQSLLEYEVKFNYPIRLIMSGEKGEVYISKSIVNLLPIAFNINNL